MSFRLGSAYDGKVESVPSDLDKGTRRVTISLNLRRFDLPPVDSALVVGRRAPIGPTAMLNALQEMMPGNFVRIDVEHPVIQTVLVHTSHLKVVPQDQLLPVVLRHAERMMDETEMVHVQLDTSVSAQETFEL